MCGIAGIISKKQNDNNQRLTQAVQCLQHRGPDGKGIWMNEQATVGLGHRRLSIIDLSNLAAQPMMYQDRFVIIHNGELYNYLEIKKELQAKGFSFRTESDTEVIVAAYAFWGSACLQKFDGMFAFAVWDAVEETLFAARDRFGEKPLFFFYDEEQFLVASEMKALWAMGVEKDINASMLYNFLTIGYTSNPSDPQETFFSNIRKLPAANSLTYSFKTHQLETEFHWQVDVEEKAITESEAIESFKYLFAESIRKRLRSDVAVGTSLSGGLDSSAIVAFCDKVVSDHYAHKCFTASFEDFEKDETRFATEVASKFNLEHHLVQFREDEIVSLMQRVMEQQEEPFSSASVLAQYKVYESAKQNGVTVLLDGQGADETLAGYHKYYRWYWQELFKSNKKQFYTELAAARKLGVQEPFSWKHKMAARLPEFSAGLLQSHKAKNAYQHIDLDRDFAFANKRNLYYATPTAFNLKGALYFNSFTNGLDELLRLADRNSMAHATEIRLPFLSYELVEFLFSLPSSFKIKDGWTKWLLRKSAEDMLPKEIVWRTDKTGFEPPQKKWMENKEVEQAILDGKKKLVDLKILNRSVLNKIKPHDAHAAYNQDWKYWSASILLS